MTHAISSAIVIDAAAPRTMPTRHQSRRAFNRRMRGDPPGSTAIVTAPNPRRGARHDEARAGAADLDQRAIELDSDVGHRGWDNAVRGEF
jgi:hypothetical protein